MKGIYYLPRNKGRRDTVQRAPGEGLYPAKTEGCEQSKSAAILFTWL